jgi:hypothetical protein
MIGQNWQDPWSVTMAHNIVTALLSKCLSRGNDSLPKPDRSRENARAVVQSLSRGNLGLQFGWYVTEEDVEEMRKENKAHNFTAHAH